MPHRVLDCWVEVPFIGFWPVFRRLAQLRQHAIPEREPHVLESIKSFQPGCAEPIENEAAPVARFEAADYRRYGAGTLSTAHREVISLGARTK